MNPLAIAELCEVSLSIFSSIWGAVHKAKAPIGFRARRRA